MLLPIPFSHKLLLDTSVNIVNPLVLELSAQCTAEKTGDLNDTHYFASSWPTTRSCGLLVPKG